MERKTSVGRQLLGRASACTQGAAGAQFEAMGLYTKWGLSAR